MKKIGTVLVIAFLVTNTTAFPFWFNRFGDDFNDIFVRSLDDVLTHDEDSILDIFNPAEPFQAPMKIFWSPPGTGLTKNHPKFQELDDFDVLKEDISFPTATPCSKGLSPTVQEDLPLPYIPNYSVVAAPFNTPGHQILGLLPKNEPLTANLLWVDDVKVPEASQLVLALPKGQVLPEKFELIVIRFKTEPLPYNARIVGYNFPRLRYPGGFFNPTNSHLIAVPYNRKSEFSAASYVCLGLLHNSHPLSYTLATQQVQPLVPPAIPSKTNQPSFQSTVVQQQMPMLSIPPLKFLRPAAVDFVTPSSPLPLTRTAENILLRSLEQFIERHPETPLFQLPDNFELSAVRPEIFVDSRERNRPIGIVPKSVPLQSNLLPLMGPPNHDDMTNIWTEFQVVVAMDMSSSLPPFFQPFILVKTIQSDLSENGVKLPVFVNINDEDNGKSSYQIVLVRNPYEPIPVHPYFIMCMVPKIQKELTSPMTTIKTPISNADVLDNPAIHPRMIATTTSKPYETTKTSIPAVKKTEPAHENGRDDITANASQSNQVEGKPLPSKKSWKYRFSFMEPSVKVIKREEATTQRSILSYFGY
ncbi:Uncharacterized protein APZ42_024462 [Daphnia magna]|uniref:Uncharacterized protein n=1 Tax=Daphnia magna TaxID=35525 RepID=A0A0P6CD50_9CRUS|nr:Uncharacterized protein APZ42_024462 [Daphnia magna]